MGAGPPGARMPKTPRRAALAALATLALVGVGCPGDLPLDDDDSVEPGIGIPGSDGCLLPGGYTAPDVAPVDDRDGDSLFADDALPLFELTFTEAQWSELCNHAQDYADNLWEIEEGVATSHDRHEYTSATLVFQGTTYENIGVRFRGRTTLYAIFFDGGAPRPDALQRCLDRRMGRKPSYKISLDEFGGVEEIGDQQTFNLVAREGADQSYLREVLINRLSNRFGVVAGRANHARLCIDGAYEGMFSLVEEVDAQRFLNQRYPEAPDGDLWKIEVDGHQRWLDGWDESGSWDGDYHPKAGTSLTDPGALRELLLTGTMIDEGADDAEVASRVSWLIDEEQWLREIAIDMAAPDYDGMYGNHKNYLLYDHPLRGFVVVPYDRDLSWVDLPHYEGGQCEGGIFGAHPCWSSETEGPTIAAWLIDQRRDEYLALMQELMDEVFVPAELLAWIGDRAETMRPWVLADRYYRPDSPACIDDPDACGYYNPGSWEYSTFDTLTNAITDRAEEVQRQLDGGQTCAEPCGGR
jgi:spore coat protein CotH